MSENVTENIKVRDATGQHQLELDPRSIPDGASVGEVMASVLTELELPENPNGYQAVLEGEQRVLNPNEDWHATVRPGDSVQARSDVQAGAGSHRIR